MPIQYSKYPKDWKTRILPAIYERAQDRCEWCELSNGQTVWSVKIGDRSVWFRVEQDASREASRPGLIKPVRVILTVAHLDHDETNQDIQLDRLALLCQCCHLRYDAPEKARRRLEKKALAGSSEALPLGLELNGE